MNGDVFLKPKAKYSILCAYVLLMLLICARFGMVLYGHDFSFHAQRIDAISQEFANGISFPIRIYHSTLGGMGYPSPMFYGDIFLFPAALLVAVGSVNAITATKITIWMIMIGAGLSIYYSLRILGIKRDAALPVAIFYVFSPYCLTDFFERVAIGESLGLVFIPLIIASTYKLLIGDTRRRYVLILAISMSCLLLSHLLTTALLLVLLFFLAGGFYCRQFLLTHTINTRSLLSIVFAACICAGISAWFYLPLLEQMFICDHLKAFSGSGYAPADNVISPVTMFFTKPGADFIQGILNTLFNTGVRNVPNDTVGAFIYPLIAAILVFIKDRKRIDNKRVVGYLIIFSVMFVGIIFVKPIWKMKFLYSIQFPWRLLTFYTVAVCILGATLLNQEHLSGNAHKRIWIGFICASLIYSLPLLYATRGIDEPQQKFNTFSIGMEDYLDERCNVRAIIERGNGVISYDPSVEYTFEKYYDGIQLEYRNSHGKAVELPLVYVYGYHAHDKYGEQEYEISSSDDGLVEVLLPEGGAGTIVVEYTGTTVQTISNHISAVSLMLLILYIAFSAKKHFVFAGSA